MTIEPRPYQLDGIEWLTHHRRGMLNDSPGLGKTIQASEAATLPAMVVAPTYLLEQWTNFLRSQYSDAIVNMASGSKLDRTVQLCKPADWYVMNYEMLRGQYEEAMPDVKTVIFDESHHLRGKETQMGLGAFKLALDTDNVYLLTATPIVRTADDLFAQLRLINPKEFGNFYNFAAQYLIQEWTGTGQKTVGISNPEGLQRVLETYALRRTYADVHMDLPPVIEETISIELPKQHAMYYNQIKNEWRLFEVTWNNVLQILQILRQFTAKSPIKQDTLVHILEDINVPTIVFCWYRETASMLGRLLYCPYITGEMDVAERKRISEKGDLLVATISSLGEGVDLSRLRGVIFYEEHYTPGSIHQALSRVRRFRTDPDLVTNMSTNIQGVATMIAQDTNIEPVVIYYIHVKNSIDEAIHDIVTGRIADLTQVVREALE